MKRSFNLIFRARKCAGAGEELLMIYIRITLDGVRTEWSLQRQCIGIHWDNVKHRVRGKSLEVKEFNEYREDVRTRIYSLYNDLLKAEVSFDGEILGHKSQKTTQH